MDAKNGILHIGLPKTGTTSFQNALYGSRDRLLREHGIFYPSIEPNHTNALCTMFLDDPRLHVSMQMQGITDVAEAEAVRRDYFDRMERDIESARWRTLVFSAEGLANLPASSLSKLKRWASKYVEDWKVLFWTRHPVNYTASNMQQLIKNGRHLQEMEENVQRFMPNFKGRMAIAFNAFGRQALEVTAFEDAVQEEGGVVAAFCRRIGMDEAAALDVASGTEVQNESMSMLATAILDSMNRQRPLLIGGKINPLRRNGEVPFICRIKGPKFDIPAKLKHRIRLLSRPDVQWLNDTFETEHYLDVFCDNLDDRADWSDIPHADAIDSLAVLVSDLINHVKRS